MNTTRFVPALICLLALNAPIEPTSAQQAGSYEELLVLFRDWREFESPPQLDGAPDYTAGQFDRRYPEARCR